MALDSFHTQIQISNPLFDMGLFSIFNKTRLSSTGKADICSYNSFPNTLAGWLITSFNWAKRWENDLINSSILPFRLQQQSHGTLLYLRLNDIWFNHDMLTVSVRVVNIVVPTNQQENVLLLSWFTACEEIHLFPPWDKESVFPLKL